MSVMMAVYTTQTKKGVSLKTLEKSHHAPLWHEFAVKCINGSHKIPITTGYQCFREARKCPQVLL